MARKKGTTAAEGTTTSKRKPSEAKGKAAAAPEAEVGAELETHDEAHASEHEDAVPTRAPNEAKRLEDVIPPVAVALLEAHPELPPKDEVLAGFGDYYRACFERKPSARPLPPVPEFEPPRFEPAAPAPWHADEKPPAFEASRPSSEFEEAPTSTFSFDDDVSPPAPLQSDLFAVLAGEAAQATEAVPHGGFSFSSETESIIVAEDEPEAADPQTVGTVIESAESLYAEAEPEPELASVSAATSALRAFDDAPEEGGATTMMQAFDLPEEPAAAEPEATVVVQAMPDDEPSEGEAGEAEPENRGAKKSKKSSRKRKS